MEAEGTALLWQGMEMRMTATYGDGVRAHWVSGTAGATQDTRDKNTADPCVMWCWR